MKQMDEEHAPRRSAAKLTLGQDELLVELVRITPELATEWLAHNSGNRRIKATSVQNVRAAISGGYWTLNGETIVRSSDGNLVDGQNRLIGISQADSSAVSLVVTLLDRQAFNRAWETTDRGSKRTIADSLRRRGVKNSKDLASALRCICNFRSSGGSYSTREQVPDAVILETWERDPEGVSVAMRRARRVSDAGLTGAPGLMAGIFYHFAARDPGAVAEFVDALATGEGLQAGDPILALRRNLLAERAKPRERRVDPTMLAAWTVKAFNAWRYGRSVSVLKWARAGQSRESFPQILPPVGSGDE